MDTFGVFSNMRLFIEVTHRLLMSIALAANADAGPVPVDFRPDRRGAGARVRGHLDRLPRVRQVVIRI